LLASATAGSETASGVASYHTHTGGYAVDQNYFNADLNGGVLHALSSASSGGNGVYSYGASAFPSNSFSASNYWVDVFFNSP
jgi:hypothetical protein